MRSRSAAVVRQLLIAGSATREPRWRRLDDDHDSTPSFLGSGPNGVPLLGRPSGRPSVEHEEARRRPPRGPPAPSGVWAIRYTCAAGHIHKEKVGPLKSEAVTAYHKRRQQARGTSGWVPDRGTAADPAGCPGG
jgi:hypothetical protein